MQEKKGWNLQYELVTSVTCVSAEKRCRMDILLFSIPEYVF